ncbi:CENP-Q, a CENPA-CAD centromere complex subunit-domain-containing protein [Xylariaceae sp. FL0016]|nr:CENP-Q, a CENPA-CAD centromere complex subunit-domain-containing protein [Xylariaceae sp. FL0016]
MDDRRRPQKRGRPPKANANQSAPEPEAFQTSQTRRKRGAPSPPAGSGVALDQSDGASQSNNQSSSGPERRRRRKDVQPSEEAGPAHEEADDENEGNSSLLRRSGRDRRHTGEWFKAQVSPSQNQEAEGPEPARKGRPKKRKKTQPTPDEEVDDGGGTGPSPRPKKKTRMRPQKSTDELPGASGAEDDSGPVAQPKKRGRPSLNGQNTSAKQKSKPNPRERPQDAEEVAEEGRPRRRRRRSGQSDEASQQAQPNPRKRRRSLKDQEEQPGQTRSSSQESDSDASPVHHLQLVPRTRRVPRHTIETKWDLLDDPSISLISSILSSSLRPVLLRLNNLTKHAHASSALNVASNRIRNKLTRGMPLPPATTSSKREDELDYERVVSGVQALEAQLDPLLHGVELLRREKERAESELEKEYRILHRLGANARAEAREKRGQKRKMHVLVPEKGDESTHADHGDVDESKITGDVLPADKAAGTVFAGLGDEAGDVELKGLAGQIGNHMESMRGNLAQIDGIVPAIAQSRALLKTVLHPHLDREALDAVLLGS